MTDTRAGPSPVQLTRIDPHTTASLVYVSRLGRVTLSHTHSLASHTHTQPREAELAVRAAAVSSSGRGGEVARTLSGTAQAPPTVTPPLAVAARQSTPRRQQSVTRLTNTE